MGMSRRCFLGTAFSAVGAAVSSKELDKGPNLKVGVLSDTHVSMRRNQKEFVNALKFYKKERVDAILIAGDICHMGFFKELQKVSEAWYSVFPNDRYEDGTPIEKIFVTGNHDEEAWYWRCPKSRYEKNKRASFSIDKARYWKQLFHEEWKPIFSKRVKGYTFVGAHWKEWYDGKLDKFLQSIKGELSSDKPFFYLQHPHLENTVFGPWAWGAWDDRGFGRKALNAYPNALAFSGHSHFPLTDERDIWQGEFTAVGTSSLSDTCLPYGRENGMLTDMDSESQMSRRWNSWARQGMLMRVWDHVIVLERYNFIRMEKLDEDWVIPIRHGRFEEHPFAFENRSKLTSAPEFPKGAKITFSEREGKNRRGVAKKQLVVTFPAADSVDWRKRVYDYEVSAEIVDCDTVKPCITKRVYQRGMQSNAQYVGTQAACVFALDELPASKKLLRFAVTPLNCYGKRGKTLYARYTFKS